MQSEINIPGGDAVVIHVTNQQELNEALAMAAGGETIALSAGVFDSITLLRRDFPEQLRITSADPDNPATFTGTVTIRSVSNLAIDNVNVIGEDPLTRTLPRISIQDSENVAISHVTVAGVISPTGIDPDDPAATGGQLLRGVAHENGVRIIGSSGVTLDDLDISNVMNGVTFRNSAGVTVRNSELHDIRSDGVVFVDASDIVIENNYFHDFHPWYGASSAVGDHPDFIQYFGGGDGIDNVVIRDNIFLQGDGGWTQSIFGHAGGAGDAASPFTNFDVYGNFIQNGHLAGIRLGDVIGGSIHHNVLIPTGYEFDNGLAPMRPTIQISAGYHPEAPRDIEIHDNILTLSWRTEFDPSGLSAAALSERNISIGDNSFLDQGTAIPHAWVDLELPDPNAFASHSAWLVEAMAMVNSTVSQIRGETGGGDTPVVTTPPVEVEAPPPPAPEPEPELEVRPWIGTDEADALFTGHGDDVVMGGAGDDTLYTRGGDDLLDGGDGNDRLTASQGSDTLTGGEGADRFVFEAFAFRDGDKDVVTDLNFAEGDWLVFSHFSEGTFGAAAGGLPTGAIIRNAAQLSALGDIDGFELDWAGNRLLTLAVNHPSTEAAVIEIAVNLATAAELNAIWQDA